MIENLTADKAASAFGLVMLLIAVLVLALPALLGQSRSQPPTEPEEPAQPVMEVHPQPAASIQSHELPWSVGQWLAAGAETSAYEEEYDDEDWDELDEYEDVEFDELDLDQLI